MINTTDEQINEEIATTKNIITIEDNIKALFDNGFKRGRYNNTLETTETIKNLIVDLKNNHNKVLSREHLLNTILGYNKANKLKVYRFLTRTNPRVEIGNRYTSHNKQVFHLIYFD